MTLFFTMSNLFIQDGNYDELKVLDEFKGNFELVAHSSVQNCSTTTTKLTHVENNLYEVVCYVSNVKDLAVFVEVEGLSFIVIDKMQRFEKDNYYSFQAFLIHDIWNYYNLEDELYNDTYNDTEIKGNIKSIFADTAKPIKVSHKVYTHKDVKPNFSIQLEKTSSWDDEKYTDGNSLDYLVELQVTR